MNDLETHIRREFTLPALDADARDDRWTDAMSRRPADTSARETRRAHRAPLRATLLAAVVVLGIAGVALAAGTDLVQHVFSDDTPAVNRVDQFAQPAPEPVTQAEYDAIYQLTLVPGVKRLGIIKGSEMVQQYQLLPREDARVLVDTKQFGRIVGVPTTDGSTLCTLISHPGERDGSATTSGCSKFDSAGLMSTYISSGFLGFAFLGIASDDVSAITATFADGTTEDVPLTQNAFYWMSTQPVRIPTRITTTRGGKEYEVDDLARFRASHPKLLSALEQPAP